MHGIHNALDLGNHAPKEIEKKIVYKGVSNITLGSTELPVSSLSFETLLSKTFTYHFVIVTFVSNSGSVLDTAGAGVDQEHRIGCHLGLLHGVHLEGRTRAGPEGVPLWSQD